MESFSETASVPVFFFDIDNCLYPRSFKIHEMMKNYINRYFREHLQLSERDAYHLHETYYTQYGLALEGLVRHHSIDPLEYNAKVDDALPLEDVIKPNPLLSRLLEDMHKAKKVKMWLFTNAYINHAKRVVRLLGIEQFFEGITYCDYAEGGRTGYLICKPDHQAFQKAVLEANANSQCCYFVDDSFINCKAAVEFGWKKTAHLLEADDPLPEPAATDYTVRSLEDLRTVFPEVF